MRGNRRLPKFLGFVLILWGLSGFAFYRATLLDYAPTFARLSNVARQLDVETGISRIIVVGGSSAMHSILASRIRTAAGSEVYNAAVVQEMYSYENVLNFVNVHAGAGDIVIYQSAGLVGLSAGDEQRERDTRAAIFADQLGLVRPSASENLWGKFQHWLSWNAVPHKPLLGTIGRVAIGSRENIEKIDEAMIEKACGNRSVAEPINRLPKLSNAYFSHLQWFISQMKKRNVSVLFVYPPILVSNEARSIWLNAIHESMEKVRSMGARIVDVDFDTILSQNEGDFCDHFHVRRSVGLRISGLVNDQIKLLKAR